MMNLSLGDVMFVSIKNCICKNFVCRMCVRWWVYVSETRFCFSCEVLPVCFVVVSVGSSSSSPLPSIYLKIINVNHSINYYLFNISRIL